MPVESVSPHMKQVITTNVRLCLGIYLLFFSIYLLFSAGHFFSTDHIAVYRTTQSIVERHTLAIAPINDEVKGVDGKYYSVFGLGQSLAAIPLYLVGAFVDGLSSPALKTYFGGVARGDWGGAVPIFFVSLLNQFVTPWYCLLVFLFGLRLGFTRQTAFSVTLIFGFSTMVWTQARDSFQHPLESVMLWSAIYIVFTHRNQLRPRHTFLTGLLLALGVLTRISLLPLVSWVALYIGYLLLTQTGFSTPLVIGQPHILRRMRVIFQPNSLLALWWFALPILIMLGVMMYLNVVRFGHPLTFHGPGQVKGFSTPFWFGLYGNLFSVGRSIFLYSPPTVCILYTFKKFYARQRAFASLCAALSLSYLGLYSVYGFWDGGWAWGPRFFLAIIPCLVLPLGYALGQLSQRVVITFISLLGTGVQALGVTVNYLSIYWEWPPMNLVPDDTFLFHPDISPLAMHGRALLEGRHIDLWVLEVYRQFGATRFWLTLLAPLLLLATSVIWLRQSLLQSRVD
jgi:hypothetical protein